ncbi:Ankyrin repeat domain containing protein [Pandoravirus neocaledonia]|uniref:Ankyrin repeat domain containing protein n=1 Tax=Pandoravirus neocaledonia TaxID=2107708 RepID=A0A2U7UDU5_9VIRU|nr:Ankyrin repeat domain containing protein [Pandoravirus neocaledonia]AVK76638.1 Ankyrin repeat domain containing protein [Pandoravirus neocaledonia]
MDSADSLCMAKLTNMPVEIILHILNQVNGMADLAACATAGAFLVAAARERIASRSHDYSPVALMSAGTPWAILRRVIERRRITPTQDWIVPAARGGDVSVLKWVWQQAPAVEFYFYYCRHDHRADAEKCHGCVASSAHDLRPRHHEMPADKRLRRQVVHVVGLGVTALYEAIERGHWEALFFLLRARMPGNSAPRRAREIPKRRFWDSLLAKAVSSPTCPVDIVDRIHAYRQSTALDGCWCHPSIINAALRGDRSDIVALLYERRCDTLLRASPFCDGGLFYETIAEGSVKTARWIIGSGNMTNHDQRQFCASDPIHASIVSAARKGHVGTVALAHNLWPQLDLGDALTAAASNGHIDILKWAADDAHNVRGWPSLAIGYAAATNGRIGTVHWLAQRRDARSCLGVGAARAVVGASRLAGCADAWLCATVGPYRMPDRAAGVDIARLLHETGIAPFDRWDALETAVASGDLDMVRLVADHRGQYNHHVMIQAVRSGCAGIVEYVCGRYGMGDAQSALDAVAGTRFDARAIGWLRANVPGLCVAEIRACRPGNPEVIGPCLCSPCVKARTHEQEDSEWPHFAKEDGTGLVHFECADYPYPHSV